MSWNGRGCHAVAMSQKAGVDRLVEGDGMDGVTNHYDPFGRGRFPVGVRTIEAADTARKRGFPGEIWYPAAADHAGQDLGRGPQDSFTVSSRGRPRRQDAVRDAAARPGNYPLIVYSHPGGGNRRSATFLTTHLSSHGYVVAALDHSEVVAPELAPRSGETRQQRAARVDTWIASRVPDVRFLIDHVLDSAARDSGSVVDPDRVGIVGHSFGGWTALAAAEVEPRIRAVVALAPAGASNPRPGVLPATLGFAWGRDVPTLYLVAENDTPLPLAGMYELFERTPATKRMVILRRADHSHFMDNVEEEHEAMRAATSTGESAWISREMRPIEELCSEGDAHLCVRGLTLCHLDATLRQSKDARRFLTGDVEAQLAARGVGTHLP
jgi:predicted dienelactone hydrolase